jgi:hypothetical protein
VRFSQIQAVRASQGFKAGKYDARNHLAAELEGSRVLLSGGGTAGSRC